MENGSKRGLLERLDAGAVICAEGYLFEFERRGYLQAGAFVPEVVLEHPEIVAQSHRDYVHAGSDVIEAFTYYGHRAKLRIIGKEELLEPLNRQALKIAKSVAAEAEGEPPLVAGNLSNTNIYDPGDESTAGEVRKICEEMTGWAVDEGADFLIGETYCYSGEARIALEVMKSSGLPCVITLSLPAEGVFLDGRGAAEACKILEDEGADVVGLNCYRGPATTLPLLEEIRAAVSCHVAGLPVPYRTNAQHPTFFHLPDPGCGCEIPGGRPFPTALDPLLCNRYEIADFTHKASEMNVRYLGVCCGNAPIYTRAMAEALGRHPPASKYTPDMSKHIFFGTDSTLNKSLTERSSRV